MENPHRSSTQMPPDLARCQAEKPNGNTFMTLGGVPGRERCSDPPIYVATELKPGPDGKIGSMSLCAACAAVMSKQLPGYAYLTLIGK